MPVSIRTVTRFEIRGQFESSEPITTLELDNDHVVIRSVWADTGTSGGSLGIPKDQMTRLAKEWLDFIA